MMGLGKVRYGVKYLEVVMREISLHIMDIVQNSIVAGASIIKVQITENEAQNLFEVKITDNGVGISEEMLSVIKDPFTTSRKSRDVGLGLSLFEATCLRCNGSLEIKSKLNLGTEVLAKMEYNNIDRPPLGRIDETILSLIATTDVDFIYKHSVNEKEFLLDTQEIKKIVGEDIRSIDIISWIREYIDENLSGIQANKW